MTPMIRSLMITAAGLVPLGSALGQCAIFNATGVQFDGIGRSVGVHGDWMVYTHRQTVRVLRWTGASWAPDEVLSFPNLVYAVDVYGDVIVAGVLGEPRTVNVFRYNGSDWVLETAIIDRGATAFQHGRTLDLHGDVLITCDPFKGGAWIYRYGNGQWSQEYESLYIWESVATDGSRCIIGNSVGTFWIYHYDGSEWVLERHWGGFRTSARRVDISGLLALVGEPPRGAPDPDIGRTEVYRDCKGAPYPWCCGGSNCVDETFFGSTDAAILGDVIALARDNQIELFRDNSGTWDRVDILSPSGASDGFGPKVEMDGESIVVGTPFDDVGGDNSGSVFAFRRKAKYVDRSHNGAENGTCQSPFNTVEEGMSATPPNGLLLVAAGTYAEAPLTISTPIKITASAGTARIE